MGRWGQSERERCERRWGALLLREIEFGLDCLLEAARLEIDRDHVARAEPPLVLVVHTRLGHGHESDQP